MEHDRNIKRLDDYQYQHRPTLSKTSTVDSVFESSQMKLSVSCSRGQSVSIIKKHSSCCNYSSWLLARDCTSWRQSPCCCLSPVMCDWLLSVVAFMSVTLKRNHLWLIEDKHLFEFLSSDAIAELFELWGGIEPQNTSILKHARAVECAFKDQTWL